jgi:hypothetical protein
LIWMPLRRIFPAVENAFGRIGLCLSEPIST